MQPRLPKNRNAAMTLFEVGLVIAIVVVLAVLLLPAILRTRRIGSHINCINNVKQVCLTFRAWEGDNGGLYPMVIPVANGGSRELVATGNVVQTFQVMSNELSTPKVLICPGDGTNPGDTSRTCATNFSTLSNSNISYFVGVDVANELNPQMILSGDGNFEISGVPVKPGLHSFGTNDPVAWTKIRHAKAGNIGLADGSVQSVTAAGLRLYLQQTGLATNRFAIP